MPLARFECCWYQNQSAVVHLIPPPPSPSPALRRLILAKAREHPPASTARVWMKSGMVEREAGDAGAERALLQEGIRRFPFHWKLHIMLGQLEERLGAVRHSAA